VDTIEIDVTRKKAGADYLTALKRFGLDPEALFWAWDRVDEQLILILVTRFFDVVGPLAVSQILFKAYNAAITPGEIDPFIVRVHSPNHNMIKTMTEALVRFQKQVVDTGKAPGADRGIFTNPTISIPMADVYVWNRVKGNSLGLQDRWRFIERRVDALAA
jgi:hypothetical protein